MMEPCFAEAEAATLLLIFLQSFSVVGFRVRHCVGGRLVERSTTVVKKGKAGKGQRKEEKDRAREKSVCAAQASFFYVMMAG